MHADGSNLTRLTNNFVEDYQPAWSPDGTKIAFTSYRDGNFEIYVMNADGSNQTRLTNNMRTDWDPTWSADGTRIAFESDRDIAIWEIYVMDANGANPIRLTNDLSTDYQPAWSPDGTKIAFTSLRENNEIFVMNPDGSNVTRLTTSGGYDFFPDWSPNGTQISFSSDRGASPFHIYVMAANGSNQTRLTNNAADDYDSAWSPDGNRIAFTRVSGDDADIYVMDANGSNQTNLTNNPGDDSEVDWQRISGSATPTPTPSPTPAAQALNLSTRMRVQTGDNVGIGGFIISETPSAGSGPSGASKNVLVRAIGPSLTQFGVPNALPDPVLELHGPAGFVTITNNNWREDPVQEALIKATGLAPSDNLESAIHANLSPGAYTAVVRGDNNTAGVALIEVYDLSLAAPAKLANISTRAFVSTGNDIVIAGFILGNNGGNDRIVLRGIGPSLTQFGVPDALTDPTLELRDNNGALLIGNDDWQDAQAAELTAAGLAPSHPLESGIAVTLSPGAYTALLSGLNNGTGNGVVEVYDRGAP